MLTILRLDRVCRFPVRPVLMSNSLETMANLVFGAIARRRSLLIHLG